MLQGVNRKAFSAAGPKQGAPRRSIIAHANKQRAAQVAISTATALTAAAPAIAAEVANTAVAVDGSLSFAVGGGVAIAGLGALLVATDPQKRCAQIFDRDNTCKSIS